MSSSTSRWRAFCTYLHEKPAAFRVIDTHAGAGCTISTGIEAAARRRMAYRHCAADACGAVAVRGSGAAAVIEASAATGENGWSRPISTSCGPSIRIAIRPPIPARRWSRVRCCGRRIACRLRDRAEYAPSIDRGAATMTQQARVVDLDGWTALPAFVPPNERRGLVLIDPPFEQPRRVRPGSPTVSARPMPGGRPACFMLWYPLKSPRRRRHGLPGGSCGAPWRTVAARATMLACEFSVDAADAGRPDVRGPPDRQSAMDAGGATSSSFCTSLKSRSDWRRRPFHARSIRA
jgi:23S rRNA (adenine2030-N6)-methyltransferase